jgi:hypothetical protein
MKKLILFLLILASVATLSYADRIKWFEITFAEKHAGTLYVLAGSTTQLGASGRYKDADFSSKDSQPSWSTNNYNIADINERGQLQALRPGTVKVFATKDKLTAAITVIITTNEAEAMPPTPTGLKVTNITATTATLTWDNAKYSPGTEYLLSIGVDENAEKGGLPVRVKTPYSLKWNLPFASKLHGDTEYYVKLKAYNNYGMSDWTKPVKFKTLK